MICLRAITASEVKETYEVELGHPLNRGLVASYAVLSGVMEFDGTDDFIATVGPHGKIVNGPLESVPQPDVIVQL